MDLDELPLARAVGGNLETTVSRRKDGIKSVARRFDARSSEERPAPCLLDLVSTSVDRTYAAASPTLLQEFSHKILRARILEATRGAEDRGESLKGEIPKPRSMRWNLAA
jgi:hypothetical protein